MDEIIIKENGWTVIQEASRERHELEIIVLAENGVIVEVRKRHNDGEEEILKSKLPNGFTLPMSIEEFEDAVDEGELTF